MLGELIAAACGDPTVLAHLGGPLGEAARAAASELAAQPDRKRRATRAAWAAIGRMAVPAGIRGVHPSWIEAGLAGLPPAARRAVATAAADPASVWLARWACSDLVPLPADDACRPPSGLAELVRLPGDQLAAWLADVGADQLAFALAAAGEQAITQTARIVGEVLVAAAARIRVAPRSGALGPVRAAIGRCKVELADHGLATIAARAIAPHVDGFSARQLAVRLPRPLGLVVARELRQHRRVSPDQVPTWAALGAG
ncbi:MAG TPA: hypothetical protein VIU61_19405 [Kofleriaceae bacterium]